VVDDGSPNLVEIFARREVHHRVGAVVDRRVEFLEFTLAVARLLAGSDVGVDLRGELATDGHRVEGVVAVVGGDDRLSIGDLLADEFGVATLALGDALHRRRHLAVPCALQLCPCH
jgi:hypothetical protein